MRDSFKKKTVRRIFEDYLGIFFMCRRNVTNIFALVF